MSDDEYCGQFFSRESPVRSGAGHRSAIRIIAIDLPSMSQRYRSVSLFARARGQFPLPGLLLIVARRIGTLDRAGRAALVGRLAEGIAALRTRSTDRAI